MSEEAQATYYAGLKAYRDNISKIKTAMSEGIEIGEANKEKYADEKAKEKQIEMAKKCKQRGMPIADIADLTGLAEDEIRNITV